MSEGVTMYFDFDIKSHKPNPFKTETAYGLPQTIGVGNAFDRIDDLHDALMDACERLNLAGYPAKDLEEIAERRV